MMDIVSIISIIGYVSLAVSAVLTIKSRVPAQTITNYEQLSVAQEKRIKALEIQGEVDRNNHLENIRAIADLQGQIKVYKELPLQEMASAMQEISRVNKTIADSNTEILLTLKKSAVIAAVDRDFLTSPDNQTVQEQTVVHQTVKSKEEQK